MISIYLVALFIFVFMFLLAVVLFMFVVKFALSLFSIFWHLIQFYFLPYDQLCSDDGPCWSETLINRRYCQYIVSSGAAVSKTVWAQGSQYTSPLTPWQDKTFLQNDSSLTVFVYWYICIWMSDTWQHCFWGPRTITFSKI